MFKRPISISVLAGALAVLAGPLFAADQVRDKKQDQTQAQDQERIYGSQMMTQKERNAYRAKMRAAKTVKEREQIRNEHHKLMQLRAKERGVTLPDMPPAGGMMGPGGMRPGGGMGGGMGPGGGMRGGN
ncbi:MAG: hypothetical protein KJ850_11400 [Gammaproteobacteria bacterium]|nr:hypothetical protein [Gammaproteobacteria bacterium]MBU1625635.1 hypothetical protein [Gammaproteobacteria bacterium]MBU1980895.1 hypothetical protein [Gammaproteobacteria bacterium]